MMHKPVAMVLDLETTGVNPKVDKIIEIGLILTDWHDVYAALHSYVNPEYDFGHNEHNGLSYTDVLGHPTLRELLSIGLWNLICLADEYIAFQANFDLSILKEELAKCDLHLPVRGTFDPWRTNTRMSLRAMCEFYDVKVDDIQWHSAFGDALALFRLVKARRDLTEQPEPGRVPFGVTPRF